MSIASCAEARRRLLADVKRLQQEEPDSKEYWQAYCDFIDAETNLTAAIARADVANGTWELKVIK